MAHPAARAAHPPSTEPGPGTGAGGHGHHHHGHGHGHDTARHAARGAAHAEPLSTAASALRAQAGPSLLMAGAATRLGGVLALLALLWLAVAWALGDPP